MTDPTGGRVSSGRTAAIAGFLIAGAVLLGVSFFAQSRRNAPARQAPPRTIITESVTATVSDSLRFTTPASLALGAMGWAAGDLHLHMQLDSVDRMPAASDIVRIAADTFTWVLPPLEPGVHRVRLFWADMSHRPVGDSTTKDVSAIR